MLDAVGIDVGYMQGPAYLYHYWNGYKFIGPQFSDPNFNTITGFLEYNGDAEKAVESVLCAIGADWQLDVPDNYINKVAKIVATFAGEEYASRLIDLARERSTQYRRYAAMHEQFLRKQLQLIEDLSMRNTMLETNLASITSSRSWKYTKNARYLSDIIKSLLNRKKP